MRPKKIVLYFDQSDTELSLMKFLLETHGYRVLTAQFEQEAVALFVAFQVDLAMVTNHKEDERGTKLAERLKTISAQVPIILLVEGSSPQFTVSDAMVARKNCDSKELLERVKMMSARKRGPRKNTERTVPAAAVMA